MFSNSTEDDNDEVNENNDETDIVDNDDVDNDDVNNDGEFSMKPHQFALGDVFALGESFLKQSCICEKRMRRKQQMQREYEFTIKVNEEVHKHENRATQILTSILATVASIDEDNEMQCIQSYHTDYDLIY